MLSKWRDLFLACFFGVAILLAVGAIGIRQYGSIPKAISTLRGTPAGADLVVDSATRSVGTVDPFSRVKVNFAIQNISTKPVSIVGDYNECNCVNCDKVWPIIISPGQKIEVSYSFQSPDEGKAFDQKVHVYTDSAVQREILLSMSGRAGPKSDEVSSGVASSVKDAR